MITIAIFFVGHVALIALAVAGMFSLYGRLASDPSFWTHVFGG
jgi:hypothetical protein